VLHRDRKVQNAHGDDLRVARNRGYAEVQTGEEKEVEREVGS
jgi:hypothetical protein